MIKRLLSFVICILITSLQLNAAADVLSEGLFDKYNDSDFQLNTGKLVDAIMSHEISIHDAKTIQFLEALTKNDLQMLSNTFYAKHGFIFKTRDLQNYFNSQSWYHPRQGDLSAKENEIISLIKQIESCENANFDELRKLFVRLDLPFTYGKDQERKKISTLYVRKFLNANTPNRYLPYMAIGTLHSNGFLVLLYEISSIETEPHMATFNLDGKLISDKAFFSIGGDLTGSTNGKLYIEKDLTIYVEIEKSSNDSKGNEIVKTKAEKYRIDRNGNINQIK